MKLKKKKNQQSNKLKTLKESNGACICFEMWKVLGFEYICTHLMYCMLFTSTVKLMFFAHVIFCAAVIFDIFAYTVFILSWLFFFKPSCTENKHLHIFNLVLAQSTKSVKINMINAGQKFQFYSAAIKIWNLGRMCEKNGSVFCDETWHILGEGWGCTW